MALSPNDPHRTPAQATHPADNAVVGGMSRRTQILRLLLRYRGSGVFAGMSLDPAAVNECEVPAEGTPDQFVADLEALGPTFVKLGQMLSTRPDIVPPEFATALERMQENTSSVPVERIRQIIEEELGVAVNKAFSHFDPVPLGCASLAQVHRAALRDGTPVAIKVQKPEVAAQVRSDLDVLKSFANAADRLTGIGRRVRFADWLGEFGKTLRAELNYEAEAETLVRFGEHLKPFPLLWVPQPVWDLSSRKVLTMQLAEGVRVDKISGLRRTEQPMDELAAALVKGYLDQMFVHGEIHADPHPGNLRVMPDGRLAIFDLGMVAHVPPRLRERLLKLLFAAVDGRGEEVAEETIALSTRLEDYDEERYLRETGQMIARYAAHDATSEGRVVLDLVRIATATGLRTPPELSLLGKTLLNLEGVCRALSPALDTRRIVERHLQHVMRARLKKSMSAANLASEAMELQHLLREGPRRMSDILSLVAENRMQMRVTGLEESHLMESLQKIANRVAAGIVTAALIMASSQMMRIETGLKLWGYPAIAMVLFLLGVFLGLGIVLSALVFDRRVRAREERGHR
ncbi:AarF/ABC1/UbiB kinase family protein [Xanthomonas campestris]|uniref:ABC1 kinase family protein n=1 Tax=Xanthomonas campestris TaxID=339 RepID=UPI0023781121|nr:AarF/UbiB family protein [Xanthomonas campestris]MEA9481738.1 AarF/UbiB family protein [Xanthomonas campestris]WDJ89523.1 AarF/ABC1/UbiB kinase family protein [Xanthomonas campestris]